MKRHRPWFNKHPPKLRGKISRAGGAFDVSRRILSLSRRPPAPYNTRGFMGSSPRLGISSPARLEPHKEWFWLQRRFYSKATKLGSAENAAPRQLDVTTAEEKSDTDVDVVTACAPFHCRRLRCTVCELRYAPRCFFSLCAFLLDPRVEGGRRAKGPSARPSLPNSSSVHKLPSSPNNSLSPNGRLQRRLRAAASSLAPQIQSFSLFRDYGRRP